jgi:ketosteroid isomerase-like protein
LRIVHQNGAHIGTGKGAEVNETEYVQRTSDAARRLRRLDDLVELRALTRRYVRRLAAREWSGMLDDFTDDAVVSIREHGERRGRDEVAQLFEQMHAAGSPPDGYLLTSPELEVSGDTATGAWTWHRLFSELPVMGGALRATGPWWEGRYRVGYRRVDTRWRFSELRFRLAASTEVAA